MEKMTVIDEIESLVSKPEIDIEKSILNSITDSRYDKLVESCNKLGEAINKVGIIMGKAVQPIIEWSKEISRVYDWQTEMASY